MNYLNKTIHAKHAHSMMYLFQVVTQFYLFKVKLYYVSINKISMYFMLFT